MIIEYFIWEGIHLMEIMTEELVAKIAEAADDKKAENIVILDVRGISSLADYFVICSGGSNNQVQAISRSIEDALEEDDIFPKNKEGIKEGEWGLLDYTDVIVHVFHHVRRNVYRLEELWNDAKRLTVHDIKAIN